VSSVENLTPGSGSIRVSRGKLVRKAKRATQPSFWGSFLADFVLDILILTADLMCLLAFYSVYRCVKTRGAKGVSIQSFVAFAVGRTLHTSSHLIGVHYNPTSLPYALYLSVDFANVLLGLLASLQLYLRSQPGDFDADVTGWFLLKKLVPRRFENALWVKHGGLPFASLFLAFLWSLFRYDEEAQTRGPVMFFACACCEICQLMAVLPQLHILHVQRRIPALLGDFLMLQGVGKLCLLGFWVLFPALHGWTPSNWLVATCTEFFNIMILLDFMVFYLRSKTSVLFSRMGSRTSSTGGVQGGGGRHKARASASELVYDMADII